ncbi:MAG TPA: VWA domain-containing protein [Thermoleophilaceae bacterium]|nr:VWA domain-containing protein [Thermoleophilaceae bacterium]
MSFASPAFLAALALVPLALLAHSLARRRARRYAVRYPGVATLAPLIPRVSSWRRILPLTLFLASLAMLALALARPHATVAVPKEQASIVLVTDVSRSMLAEDVDPSRLEAARAAAQSFLEELPEEARVGAVAFSTDPHTVEAPTDDRDEIEDLIDALSADGGTAAGDALAAAIGLVDDGPEEERPPAAILLLSDGETTTGRDPLPVARQAGRIGIPIHTVALGTRTATITTPDGSLIPVPPDPEAMRRIAELSGGRAFEVDDADELSGLYEDLGSRVATEEEQREITGAFAAGGILLLMAAAALGTRATARLP